MKYIPLVLILGCYGVSYTPLPLEEIDSASGVTLYGLPSQFSAADMENLIEIRIQELMEIRAIDYHDAELIRNVDIYVASSFEDMDRWCVADMPPSNYVGCMYPSTADVAYEGTGGWFMVIRPDHVNSYELLKFVVHHEVTHMAMWCREGHVDADHSHSVWGL